MSSHGHRHHAGVTAYLIGTPDTLAALDHHCPDCDSEVHYWTDDLGMDRVDVRHDDTCPTWRAMQ